MIENMSVLRVTEAELARDTHAVLAKVQEGVEVIVEQDHRPVAIRTPDASYRRRDYIREFGRTCLLHFAFALLLHLHEPYTSIRRR